MGSNSHDAVGRRVLEPLLIETGHGRQPTYRLLRIAETPPQPLRPLLYLPPVWTRAWCWLPLVTARPHMMKPPPSGPEDRPAA